MAVEAQFNGEQARNWKAESFWKTPEALSSMRGREGFHVVVDGKSKEVIAAYYDYSASSLERGARAEEFNSLGLNKLFDAKFDMVVRPDIRGRGIGKLILQRMVDKAKSLGAEHIKVNASNNASFKWFQRYEPIHSIPDGGGGNHVFRISDLERRLASGVEVRGTAPKGSDTLKGADTLPDLGKTLDGRVPTQPGGEGAGAVKPTETPNKGEGSRPKEKPQESLPKINQEDLQRRMEARKRESAI